MVAGPEVISKATSSIKHVFLRCAELEQFGESQTIFSVTVSFHCNNFSLIYFFKIAQRTNDAPNSSEETLCHL